MKKRTSHMLYNARFSQLGCKDPGFLSVLLSRRPARLAFRLCDSHIRIPLGCQATAGHDDCRRSGIAVGQGGDREASFSKLEDHIPDEVEYEVLCREP
jgi:hypothetical protein